MRARQFFCLLNLIAWGLSLSPGQAHAGLADDASARCKAIQTTDFSRIPDAPTQVMAAASVEPTGGAAGYCQISGYVAPNVGFLLRLPTDHWNGKFIELGCGGACGSTDHIFECDNPLRRGYACIVSDGGHHSTGGDVKWAYNQPQAVTEYIVRASHVTALVGKAITERYYDRAPLQSYFMGCSAGGIQAMWEAQKFPWDFNGIVAGGPALNLNGVLLNVLWANRVLTDANGKALLGKDDLNLLHKAVVAKCDLNDGIKDGLIGDPRACRFDPEELRCAAGKSSGCLTAEQIAGVKKVYGGPATSGGQQILLPSALRGSEETWLDWFEGSSDGPDSIVDYMADWIRYAILQPNPGPGWKARDFDFDRDYKRLGMASSAWAPTNPDLREFKNAGAKLLMYTGWNDAVEGALRTVDYYETAERIMGGRANTQNSFRLFVVPGMNHCSLGDGPFAIDYLSYLETWVEKGQAPEKLIGSHVKTEDLMAKAMKGDQEAWHTLERRLEFPLDSANVEFSRPIYPYPTQAKYLGHGDAKNAASFGPVQQ